MNGDMNINEVLFLKKGLLLCFTLRMFRRTKPEAPKMEHPIDSEALLSSGHSLQLCSPGKERPPW